MTRPNLVPDLPGRLDLMECIEKESESIMVLAATLGSMRSRGTWQHDHTFVMNRLILGQGYPAQVWTFNFDGEKLRVRVKFGTGPEISIDGKTGQ
jgi:hypothetical protein